MCKRVEKNIGETKGEAERVGKERVECQEEVKWGETGGEASGGGGKKQRRV